MHIIEYYINKVLDISYTLFLILQMFGFVITTTTIKNATDISQNLQVYQQVLSSPSMYDNEFTTTEYDSNDIYGYRCKCWIIESDPMVCRLYIIFYNINFIYIQIKMKRSQMVSRPKNYQSNVRKF